MVWNFIIYIGEYTIIDESLKIQPYDSKVVLEPMAPLLNERYNMVMG
jgi:hypothetical protein